MVHARIRELLGGQAPRAAGAEKAREARAWIFFVAYVFVLAIFVGFEVIAKAPPTLHTPLMSGSNAISGITVIGASVGGHAAHGAEHDWVCGRGLCDDQRSGQFPRHPPLSACSAGYSDMATALVNLAYLAASVLLFWG